MRKYIILFLLWGVFGNAQYNLFARQNFAKSVSTTTFNTYIGGVSGTISTASALATKLGISVGAISNFTVVGSDIKCKITGGYVMSDVSFTSDTSITYFTDSGICTSYDGRSFANCTNITKIELPAATSITKVDNFILNNSLDRIYNPVCVSYGATVGNNSLFSSTGFKQGCRIYTHPSMSTINAGGLEGDLADAASKGALIRFVSNLTVPNVLTSANIGNIYNTAIQLLDNGSANAIDYYEVYLNGVFYGKVLANDYIFNLTPSTSYSITAYAVDMSGNISPLSGVITQSTNTTYPPVPTTGLVSYYKLDSNSNDSFGSNNGTDTDVSYVSGKVNNAGSYNGTTSRTVVGNPSNLQISTGSISCWVKTSAAGSSDRFLFGKTLAYGVYLRDGVVTIYSWAGASGSKTTGININDGLWHHIVYVFESGTSLNYVYIDGVLKLTTSMTVSGQTDPVTIGDSNYSQKINAVIDEASVYNVKLSPAQVSLIYNAGNGITY